MSSLDIIDDKLNIKKIYENQLKESNNEEYIKYTKFLNFYFQSEHKKEKYKKSCNNEQIILTDKQNPKKVIKITPSKFVDMNKLYFELKTYNDHILYKITSMVYSKNNINEQNRADFEILKDKYLLYQEKIKDIDSIKNNFYTEIGDLLNEKIEKSLALAKYFYKRNEQYILIEIMIPEKLKNNLIKIYSKNNKNKPSLKEINKLAKDNDVPSNEIEKWFEWIEASYKYLIAQMEVNKINKSLIEKEIQFDINTKNMIIKKFQIN